MPHAISGYSESNGAGRPWFTPLKDAILCSAELCTYVRLSKSSNKPQNQKYSLNLQTTCMYIIFTF